MSPFAADDAEMKFVGGEASICRIVAFLED
jgi:hypothetical protein